MIIVSFPCLPLTVPFPYPSAAIKIAASPIGNSSSGIYSLSSVCSETLLTYSGSCVFSGSASRASSTICIVSVFRFKRYSFRGSHKGPNRGFGGDTFALSLKIPSNEANFAAKVLRSVTISILLSTKKLSYVSLIISQNRFAKVVCSI